MCVKQACSRTIQTSGANRFVRGSASPSMRERRINGLMMPYLQGKLQAHRLSLASKPLFLHEKGGRLPAHLRPENYPIETQATSKRSRFITLFQAATKSFTNFSFESAQA